MCLSWFYASGYCPFPLPAPPKSILNLTFHVLGTTVLPSARCAGQVHPSIAFALDLKPGSVESQDFSGNTAQAPWEGRWSWRWAGRPSFPVMLKPVHSPHQTCLVFELSEAFGTGISHPCWAGGCVTLCACTWSETRNVPRENPCA